MTRISAQARAVYDTEMQAPRATASADQRWHHLERAHIVSQPFAWLHTRNHIAMLRLALTQHDRREAFGQVIRILVAAPGSLTGRYPEGNTGRVAAGLTTPMPVPRDLAAVMRSA